MSAKTQVLVVDDEADIRELLGHDALAHGAGRRIAPRAPRRRYALLAQNSYDLCLTDMRLPDGDGLDGASSTSPSTIRTCRSRSSRRTAAPRTRWPR